MKSAKKFDVVVYGASGFTGQLVAEYLASREDPRIERERKAREKAIFKAHYKVWRRRNRER